MVKGQLEVIEWYDAITESGWQSEGDKEHEPSISMSVGWVLKENKAGVSLAPNITPIAGTFKMDTTDQFGDVTTIPKGMIKKRTKVKL